jgi:hypothetical protein
VARPDRRRARPAAVPDAALTRRRREIQLGEQGAQRYLLLIHEPERRTHRGGRLEVGGRAARGAHLTARPTREDRPQQTTCWTPTRPACPTRRSRRGWRSATCPASSPSCGWPTDTTPVGRRGCHPVGTYEWRVADELEGASSVARAPTASGRLSACERRRSASSASRSRSASPCPHRRKNSLRRAQPVIANDLGGSAKNPVDLLRVMLMTANLTVEQWLPGHPDGDAVRARARDDDGLFPGPRRWSACGARVICAGLRRPPVRTWHPRLAPGRAARRPAHRVRGPARAAPGRVRAFAAIALGRAISTVSREVAGSGGGSDYRPAAHTDGLAIALVALSRRS